MSIQTVLAHFSCADLKTSLPWYEKLFGKPPIRQPMPGLAEWQFTDSAEVQLFEDKTHAGHSTLTLGVLPIEPERQRLVDAGLNPGPIEDGRRLLHHAHARPGPEPRGFCKREEGVTGK